MGEQRHWEKNMKGRKKTKIVLSTLNNSTIPEWTFKSKSVNINRLVRSNLPTWHAGYIQGKLHYEPIIYRHIRKNKYIQKE